MNPNQQKINFIDYIFNLPKNIKEELNNKMSEENRHYHNVYHVNNMLKIFQDCHIQNRIPKESDKVVLYLAILFHDAVYKVGDEKNERNSAEFMRNILKKNKVKISQIRINEASVLIENTKYNYEDKNPFGSNQRLNKLFQILKELDHSSFVTESFNFFKKNTENIKKEAIAFGLSENEVVKNQKEFLRKILNIDIFLDKNLNRLKNYNAKQLIAEL